MHCSQHPLQQGVFAIATEESVYLYRLNHNEEYLEQAKPYLQPRRSYISSNDNSSDKIFHSNDSNDDESNTSFSQHCSKRNSMTVLQHLQPISEIQLPTSLLGRSNVLRRNSYKTESLIDKPKMLPYTLSMFPSTTGCFEDLAFFIADEYGNGWIGNWSQEVMTLLLPSKVEETVNNSKIKKSKEMPEEVHQVQRKQNKNLQRCVLATEKSCHVNTITTSNNTIASNTVTNTQITCSSWSKNNNNNNSNNTSKDINGNTSLLTIGKSNGYVQVYEIESVAEYWRDNRSHQTQSFYREVQEQEQQEQHGIATTTSNNNNNNNNHKMTEISEEDDSNSSVSENSSDNSAVIRKNKPFTREKCVFMQKWQKKHALSNSHNAPKQMSKRRELESQKSIYKHYESKSYHVSIKSLAELPLCNAHLTVIGESIMNRKQKESTFFSSFYGDCIEINYTLPNYTTVSNNNNDNNNSDNTAAINNNDRNCNFRKEVDVNREYFYLGAPPERLGIHKEQDNNEETLHTTYSLYPRTSIDKSHNSVTVEQAYAKHNTYTMEPVDFFIKHHLFLNDDANIGNVITNDNSDAWKSTLHSSSNKYSLCYANIIAVQYSSNSSNYIAMSSCIDLSEELQHSKYNNIRISESKPYVNILQLWNVKEPNCPVVQKFCTMTIADPYISLQWISTSSSHTNSTARPFFSSSSSSSSSCSESESSSCLWSECNPEFAFKHRHSQEEELEEEEEEEEEELFLLGVTLSGKMHVHYYHKRYLPSSKNNDLTLEDDGDNVTNINDRPHLCQREYFMEDEEQTSMLNKSTSSNMMMMMSSTIKNSNHVFVWDVATRELDLSLLPALSAALYIPATRCELPIHHVNKDSNSDEEQSNDRNSDNKHHSSEPNISSQLVLIGQSINEVYTLSFTIRPFAFKHTLALLSKSNVMLCAIHNYVIALPLSLLFFNTNQQSLNNKNNDYNCNRCYNTDDNNNNNSCYSANTTLEVNLENVGYMRRECMLERAECKFGLNVLTNIKLLNTSSRNGKRDHEAACLFNYGKIMSEYLFPEHHGQCSSLFTAVPPMMTFITNEIQLRSSSSSSITSTTTTTNVTILSNGVINDNAILYAKHHSTKKNDAHENSANNEEEEEESVSCYEEKLRTFHPIRRLLLKSMKWYVSNNNVCTRENIENHKKVNQSENKEEQNKLCEHEEEINGSSSININDNAEEHHMKAVEGNHTRNNKQYNSEEYKHSVENQHQHQHHQCHYHSYWHNVHQELESASSLISLRDEKERVERRVCILVCQHYLQRAIQLLLQHRQVDELYVLFTMALQMHLKTNNTVSITPQSLSSHEGLLKNLLKRCESKQRSHWMRLTLHIMTLETQYKTEKIHEQQQQEQQQQQQQKEEQPDEEQLSYVLEHFSFSSVTWWMNIADKIGLAVCLIMPESYHIYHLRKLYTQLNMFVEEQYASNPMEEISESVEEVAATVLPMLNKHKGKANGSNYNSCSNSTSYNIKNEIHVHNISTSLLLAAAVQPREELTQQETDVSTVSDKCSFALQEYVDETGEVQCPLMYELCYGNFASAEVQRWTSAYLCLLDDNALYLVRCAFELHRNKMWERRAASNYNGSSSIINSCINKNINENCMKNEFVNEKHYNNYVASTSTVSQIDNINNSNDYKSENTKAERALHNKSNNTTMKSGKIVSLLYKYNHSTTQRQLDWLPSFTNQYLQSLSSLHNMYTNYNPSTHLSYLSSTHSHNPIRPDYMNGVNMNAMQVMRNAHLELPTSPISQFNSRMMKYPLPTQSTPLTFTPMPLHIPMLSSPLYENTVGGGGAAAAALVCGYDATNAQLAESCREMLEAFKKLPLELRCECHQAMHTSAPSIETTEHKQSTYSLYGAGRITVNSLSHLQPRHSLPQEQLMFDNYHQQHHHLQQQQQPSPYSFYGPPRNMPMYSSHMMPQSTINTSTAIAAASSSSSVAMLPQQPCSNPECQSKNGPQCVICEERFKRKASSAEDALDYSFAWCTRCLHGGHYIHLVEWFAKHDKCAVEFCECQCCLKEPPRPHSHLSIHVSIVNIRT